MDGATVATAHYLSFSGGDPEADDVAVDGPGTEAAAASADALADNAYYTL